MTVSTRTHTCFGLRRPNNCAKYRASPRGLPPGFGHTPRERSCLGARLRLPNLSIPERRRSLGGSGPICLGISTPPATRARPHRGTCDNLGRTEYGKPVEGRKDRDCEKLLMRLAGIIRDVEVFTSSSRPKAALPTVYIPKRTYSSGTFAHIRSRALAEPLLCIYYQTNQTENH